MTSLPDYVPFKMYPKVPLRQYFTAAGSDALDLLEKMLVFDPSKRWTAEECLKHAYFRNSPLPTKPEKLPRKAPDPEKVAETLKRKPGLLTDEEGTRPRKLRLTVNA